MAQKYYNTQETAKLFDVSVEEIRQMLDRRELHGYRDGADWKFKVEDIDRMAQERRAAKPAASAEEDGGDVLLSEVELGQSELGTSGTVIGMESRGRSTTDSDIQLAGSDIKTSKKPPAPAAKPKDDVDSKVAQFEELDLTLDEDLTLEDSSVKLSGKIAAGSAVDLTGKDLEDDDLVLGGSGTGSDVTIGGDSGISLVDPSDSGLSLEHPLNLSGAGEESLELGEDDMLLSSGDSSTKLKGDDDFLLTPLEDAADDDSESGSQVIALDTEGDESATMIGTSAGVSMAAMLDEDLSAQPAMEIGLGMGSTPMMGAPVLGIQSGGFADGAPAIQPTAVLFETPYTGWQITGLVFVALFLMLCGMMTYDLVRNMWSWDGPYSINSALMDTIVGVFEGK